MRDTQEHFLETEQSKVQFFTQSCRLSVDVLPEGGPKSRYFPDHFPISTLPHGRDKDPTIRFAFIDEGLFSLRKFERFVLQNERLFRALGRFRVVYVADAQRNLAAAGKYLAQRFPRYPDALREEDFPLGIEHFLEYLEARDVFDNTRLVPTPEETDVLEEGERVYTSPLHSELEDVTPRVVATIRRPSRSSSRARHPAARATTPRSADGSISSTPASA